MKTPWRSVCAIGMTLAIVVSTSGRTHAGREQGSASAPVKATLAVVGGFLIDGFGGPPRPNAVVLIDGETIVAVGDEGRLAVPAGAKVIDANGLTVMPGLIDTHVHLDLLGHAVYPVWHPMVAKEYVDVMRLGAAQLLAHGVTTARDAGGETKASLDVRDRVNRGELKGPRLLVSGDMIGRWSEQAWSRWYRNHISINVHNVEEARKAARQLLDAGVDFVKIRTLLSVDEMRAITDEAHKRGKLVGAHVGPEEEIADFISGRVDVLDHVGSGRQNPLFREETLQLLARTQIPVGQSDRVWRVYHERMAWPEALDDPELRGELGKYADVILKSLADLPSIGYFAGANRRIDPRAGRQLYDAGVRLVIGSDSGTPASFHSGAAAGQMSDFVHWAGMTPNEAIMAATRDAASALRMNTGAITAGRLADIILVKGNPLDDIAHVQNVVHVIKGGVQYK